MSFFRAAKIAIITLAAAALAACGSSNSSTTADPFGSTTTGSTASTSTIFGNISTVNGRTGISLATTPSQVDVNSGQVLVSATVLNNGVAAPGVPVTFSVDGPAFVQSGRETVSTDSNGVAITRITTGNTLSTTNVIISGSARVGTRTAIAKTSLQIVRGGGVIRFSNGSNVLEAATWQVPITFNGPVEFLQLIPFKVTDSNGNPRVGVPVTVSVYSITSLVPDDVSVSFLVPPVSEPNQQTITTDSAGEGVFNMSVSMTAPTTPGMTRTTNLVLKAVTNDAIPVTAFLGASYSVTKREQ